jgi:hypothetical protein
MPRMQFIQEHAHSSIPHLAVRRDCALYGCQLSCSRPSQGGGNGRRTDNLLTQPWFRPHSIRRRLQIIMALPLVQSWRLQTLSLASIRSGSFLNTNLVEEYTIHIHPRVIHQTRPQTILMYLGQHRVDQPVSVVRADVAQFAYVGVKR